MRTLKLAALLFSLATAAAAQSVVKSTFASGSNVASITQTITPASGNMLLVHCAANVSETFIVSSSAGEQFTSPTPAPAISAGGRVGQWFYALAAGGTETVKCAGSKTAAFANLFVMEVSGAKQAGPVSSAVGSGTVPTLTYSAPSSSAVTVMTGICAGSCSPAQPVGGTTLADGHGNGALWATVTSGAPLTGTFSGPASDWEMDAIAAYSAPPPKTVTSIGLRITYADVDGTPRNIDVNPGQSSFAIGALVNYSDKSATVIPMGTVGINYTPPAP